jgi:hypothetical protein
MIITSAGKQVNYMHAGVAISQYTNYCNKTKQKRKTRRTTVEMTAVW